MCSELTPRARIPDTRIPQLMQPCCQGKNQINQRHCDSETKLLTVNILNTCFPINLNNWKMDLRTSLLKSLRNKRWKSALPKVLQIFKAIIYWTISTFVLHAPHPLRLPFLTTSCFLGLSVGSTFKFSAHYSLVRNSAENTWYGYKISFSVHSRKDMVTL